MKFASFEEEIKNKSVVLPSSWRLTENRSLSFFRSV